jgi:hypothetical protein
MSEEARFWIGVFLFVVACSRLMYGLWAWVLVPSGDDRGVFSPELKAWAWIRERLQPLRSAWWAARKKKQIARRRARAEEETLAAMKAVKGKDVEEQAPRKPGLVGCPDCGARISPRAIACPRCGAPLKRSHVAPKKSSVSSSRLITAAILVSALGFFLYVANLPRGGGPAQWERPARVGRNANAGNLGATSNSFGPGVGEEGQLKGLGLVNGVWLALDENSWDALLDAQNQAGQGGPGAGAALFRLAEAGKVKIYPIGTRVRVVKSGLASRLVEVLDGPDRGDRGWVQFELVSRP